MDSVEQTIKILLLCYHRFVRGSILLKFIPIYIIRQVRYPAIRLLTRLSQNQIEKPLYHRQKRSSYKAYHIKHSDNTLSRIFRGFLETRAQVTDYWKIYQNCVRLFGEQRGVLPYKQLSSDWQPLVMQAAGCMASAWARLAADVGDVNATFILEKEWGYEIPQKVVEAGLLQKARFVHMS